MTLPEVARFFLNHYPAAAAGKGKTPVSRAFAGLVQNMWSSKGTVSPLRLAAIHTLDSHSTGVSKC